MRSSNSKGHKIDILGFISVGATTTWESNEPRGSMCHEVHEDQDQEGSNKTLPLQAALKIHRSNS